MVPSSICHGTCRRGGICLQAFVSYSIAALTRKIPPFIDATMPAQRENITVVVRASDTIPLIYRLVLTFIEPFFAACGALLVFRTPEKYLATMTRDGMSFTEPSTFLYTQLGGAWLFFAFVEVVLLRVLDDRRLWRLLCAGMLLSDLPYCHSAAQAVGGWSSWLDLRAWTSEDHVVFWSTMPMALVKVLIVLGVGVKTGYVGQKRH